MSLEDDALHLAELDRSVVRALIEDNTEDFGRALGAYMDLRKRLKTQLLDESAISVSQSDAAEVLRKITLGDGLPTGKVLSQISAYVGEDGEVGEFDEHEI